MELRSFSNSLYRSWEEQFYPDFIRSWMVRVNARPEGGISPDVNFFVEFEKEFRGHQIRLGGGSSSDSYCYP